MYAIHKIRANPVVDFAAQELKRYLRMMMPRCGEIPIDYAPEAADGFRLGLMEDFSLDTSDARDLDLDDILYMDTDEQGGILAGALALKCVGEDREAEAAFDDFMHRFGGYEVAMERYYDHMLAYHALKEIFHTGPSLEQ